LSFSGIRERLQSGRLKNCYGEMVEGQVSGDDL
jgi:hypothetical protein